MKRCFLLTLLCTCGLAQVIFANNVAITNLRTGGQEIITGDISILFDLSWENSWNVTDGPANFDAVWVFGKYRVNGSPWRHMPSADLVDNSSILNTENYTEGAIVYRENPGTGNNDFTDISFVFNYRAEGIDDNADLEVQLFAVEMVLVPTGAFSLGNGPQGGQGAFIRNPASGSSPPYLTYPITAEVAINVGPQPFSFNYLSGGDQLGPIPADFPKGHAGFYCMKYEVSQQQWVDFFNTLTPVQQNALDATG
ncbi:MAG: hypothetical protein AAGA31_17000, partial [Bacteroidota bacterium]